MNHQKVIGSKLLLFAHLTSSSRPGLRPVTQLLLTLLPFQESSQDCLCWEGASCIHPCFLGRCPFLRVVNVWPWVSLCLCKRGKCCHCRRHYPSTCIRNQSTSCVFAVFTLNIAISRHSPFFQGGGDGRGWQPPPRPLAWPCLGLRRLEQIPLLWRALISTDSGLLLYLPVQEARWGWPFRDLSQTGFLPWSFCYLSQQRIVYFALKDSEQFRRWDQNIRTGQCFPA